MNPTQTVLLRPQTKKRLPIKQATPEWYRSCCNEIGDLECQPFNLLFIMLILFWTLLLMPALCFKFHLYLQVQILDDIFYVFINVFQHFTVICFNFHLPSSKRLERFFWCNKSQLDFVRLPSYRLLLFIELRFLRLLADFIDLVSSLTVVDSTCTNALVTQYLWKFPAH